MQLLGPGVVVVTGSPVAAEVWAGVRRLQVSGARAARGAAARTSARMDGRRADRSDCGESMRGLLREGWRAHAVEQRRDPERWGRSAAPLYARIIFRSRKSSQWGFLRALQRWDRGVSA